MAVKVSPIPVALASVGALMNFIPDCANFVLCANVSGWRKLTARRITAVKTRYFFIIFSVPVKLANDDKFECCFLTGLIVSNHGDVNTAHDDLTGRSNLVPELIA